MPIRSTLFSFSTASFIGNDLHISQGEKDEDSPKRNRRESSSEEYSDEDGEVNKEEEADEERDRQQIAEEIRLEDLSRARITRDMLAKYCFRPWFEEFVKGEPHSVLSRLASLM